MFHKIIEWIKGIFKQRASNGEEMRSVVLDDTTINHIDLWARMYEDNATWLIRDKKHSAGIPAAIASELARLTTLELKSDITGSPRADYLDSQYKKVLGNLRIQTEYACALGGMILKPYVNGDKIDVEFIQADRFVPTGFNGSQITSCQFIERITRDGKIYTRLESHDFDGKKCVIKNRAYESRQKSVLGHEIELSDVTEWLDMKPEATITNIDAPLFAYFKIPQANNKNRQSPFGVSVYSKAEELIKDADEQWNLILWEYKGSELAIDASESIFKADANGNKQLPKGKERLFRRYELQGGISEKPFIEVFSPEIRDSSLFNGFNQILRRIEFNCGLAYGTLSDVQIQDRTATEVIFSKQRSYSFVSDIQNALKMALEDLIKAMDVWATLYKLAPAGTYETSFEFDDSLITDSATENQLMMQEATSGLIRKELYLAKRYGVTEERAREMLPVDARVPEEE